ILDGGEGRADPLAEIILAQRADIVVLIECDSAEVLDRIAARLSMDFVHSQGQKHACAILSRWTIRDSINHAALTKNMANSFLEATILNPTGGEWSVAALHLSPHAEDADETKREKELKFVLETLADHRRHKRGHIV